MKTTLTIKPLAPATYLGRQHGTERIPDFDLYLLTADVAGHPIGSTVSEMTLRELGYALPNHRRIRP